MNQDSGNSGIGDQATGRTGTPGAAQAVAGRAREAAQRIPSLARHLIAAVVLAALLLALTSAVSSFRDFQIAEIATDVVAVAGLTFLVGLSGQISLGQGAFVAIGAYVTALLMTHQHWPLIVVFIVAALATALAGAVIGVAAARLRGPYLAGATLLLAVALPTLANRFEGVLGGDQGLTVNITAPAGLGGNFPLTRWQAWIACAAALVTLVLLANLARSRVGRSWRAIRDDEVAAALAGLKVGRLRVLAFVVSAGCAGLAGSLFALTAGLVAPTSFTLPLSIGLLSAALIGGLGSLAGAVWGSIVLVLLPTYVTDVATSHGLSSSAGANVPLVVYGVVLIVVMLAFPYGIQGGLRRLADLVTGSVPGRRRSASAVSPPGTAAPVRSSDRQADQPTQHQEIATGPTPDHQKEGPA
jgi:branched-chain amino acid transport system permease protein